MHKFASLNPLNYLILLRYCDHPSKDTRDNIGNIIPNLKYLQIRTEDNISLPKTLKVIAVGFNQTYRQRRRSHSKVLRQYDDYSYPWIL